ncbi:MAG: alpha-ribazole phosphatase family protein [Zoogloeaceae bacterium]|jgi:alpha-ribazole phosphatase|nr:alpha-ribazole phosphatase family protein [Zoogloeaceae bacterium]
MEAEIFLVRHPPIAGGEGRCYGVLDLPLALPAANSVASIRAHLPPRFQVWSSPLRRCLDLAKALADADEVRPHPGLREMNFGDWEGLNWADIPRAELESWAANITGYRPPGGESAEEMQARALVALREIRASPSPLPRVCVTHAGVIRALVAAQQGLPPARWLDIRPAYGEVLRLASEQGDVSGAV